MSVPSPGKIHLASLVFAGAVLPAIFVSLDTWLLASWSLVPLMFSLVVEVGLTGPICAYLVRPRWMMWAIYAWIWLVMETMVVTLAMAEPYSGISISADTLPIALLCGQLGLILVWGVLGGMRWTYRWPLALLIALVFHVPVVWHRVPATELCILIAIQDFLLLAVLCWLAWMGFRLVRSDERTNVKPSQSPQALELRESQFQLRDVLLWTTAIAIVLSMVKLTGHAGATIAAWDQAKAEITRSGVSAIFLPTPTTAFCTCAVILVSIWASLGAGTAAFRFSFFLLIVSLIAISQGISDYYRHAWVWGWAPPLWRGLDVFFYFEQPLLVWHYLTAGMLFAALLMLRSLGFRLRRLGTNEAQATGSDVSEATIALPNR